jgi:hypothetical protein
MILPQIMIDDALASAMGGFDQFGIIGRHELREEPWRGSTGVKPVNATVLPLP